MGSFNDCVERCKTSLYVPGPEFFANISDDAPDLH